MALCSLITHSNTTLVKVKCLRRTKKQVRGINSNTTLVKVKCLSTAPKKHITLNSNTTLVKVKLLIILDGSLV